MEALATRAVAGTVAKVRAALLTGVLGLGLTTLAAGCVTTEAFQHGWGDQPSGNVCQVVATWNPEVVFTPDPAHGGVPIPGLAGRVYLFGPEINAPLVGDGSVVVDLYDSNALAAAAGKPVAPLEEWAFDKDNLKRLRKRDAVGWGYTLFLPWATYKPEICHVEVRLRYVPAKGCPLYAQSAPMLLRPSGPTMVPVVSGSPLRAPGT